MANLLLYSPSDVTVSIAGIHVVSGFADDTFVSISKDISPFQIQRAMNGDVARLYNHDEGFRMELTLAQSSATNNILSALYNIDAATRIGKFPVFVTDGRGSTEFFALTAWVDRLPDVSFGQALSTRTWIIQCTQAAMTVGGNTDQTALEQALDFGVSLLPLFREFGVPI